MWIDDQSQLWPDEEDDDILYGLDDDGNVAGGPDEDEDPALTRGSGRDPMYDELIYFPSDRSDGY